MCACARVRVCALSARAIRARMAKLLYCAGWKEGIVVCWQSDPNGIKNAKGYVEQVPRSLWSRTDVAEPAC